MENILVSNPYECILIYIDNKPAAGTLTTNVNKFYNYADYVTGDLCLVTTETAGTCTKSISAVIDNCQFYASETTCGTCLPGYFLAETNTKCTACHANCLVCTSASVCTTCKRVTEAPDSGACAIAVGGTNCLTSEEVSSTIKCRSCVYGAYFTSLTTEACALQSDYATKEPACHWSCGAQADLTPPGTYAGAFCSVTNDATKCRKCLAGSYLKSTTDGSADGTCMTCGLNCLECDDTTYGSAPVCSKWDYQGYSAVIA